MAEKKEYFYGKLRKVSHKGITHTRGFIVPTSGNFRSNLEFEADMNLKMNDKVKFYMNHGEPIITGKVKKR